MHCTWSEILSRVPQKLILKTTILKIILSRNNYKLSAIRLLRIIHAINLIKQRLIPFTLHLSLLLLLKRVLLLILLPRTQYRLILTQAVYRIILLRLDVPLLPILLLIPLIAALLLLIDLYFLLLLRPMPNQPLLHSLIPLLQFVLN